MHSSLQKQSLSLSLRFLFSDIFLRDISFSDISLLWFFLSSCLILSHFFCFAFSSSGDTFIVLLYRAVFLSHSFFSSSPSFLHWLFVRLKERDASVSLLTAFCVWSLCGQSVWYLCVQTQLELYDPACVWEQLVLWNCACVTQLEPLHCVYVSPCECDNVIALSFPVFYTTISDL